MGRRSKRKAPGTELGRSPSGVPGAAGDIGRWNSRRKAEIALRILKGEDLDGLSRELKVSTARLAQWRDDFLAAGQSGLMSREPDARDAGGREEAGEHSCAMPDAELPVEDRQDAHRAPRRRHHGFRDPCGCQPERLWSGGPEPRQTSVNTPQLDLCEDPLQGVPADRRFAPRNDKSGRRCAEDGEHHFRRRTARFERNDCTDGACKRFGCRAC